MVGIVRSFTPAEGGVPSTTTFTLDEGPVELAPGDLDLRPFVGHVTDLRGTLAEGAPTTLQVATATLAASTFRCSGNTRIGRSVQVRIDVPDIGRWYLYASFGRGIMPLESYQPYGSGTLWLEPASLVSLGLGPMIRTWQDRLLVPADPQLIGIEVCLQGAVHIEPGPLEFLNSECITLLP